MFLRKTAVAITAMAAFSVPGMPAAHAEAGDFCGTTVFDYGKVALNACWRVTETGHARAGFRFRIVSPTTDFLWNDCFVDFQIRDDERLRRWVKDFDCMALAQGNRGAYVWDWISFRPERDTCYEVQAKWYGIYNNTAVGSHENAHSDWWVCGGGDAVVDAAYNDAVFGLPPVNGVAIVEPEV